METALNEAWEMRLRVEWVDGCTYKLYPPPAAKDDKAGLTEEKAIALMLAQPSMIKRPMLDLGDRRIAGFKEDLYAGALRG